MIRKTIFQGLAIAAVMFALWFGLSQIDFMKLFNLEKATANTEEKLGDMIWEAIERAEKVVRNDTVNSSVDSIVTRIARKNNIDRKKIKLHVIRKDEVNAFAFPGNHLVVYTGLIDECENESELAGVLAHELAHIEKRHVMKKLIREIGLATIMAAAGGDPGVVGQMLHTVTSSAYDRSLETEADLTAVDYLIKSDISPEPFAELMYRMATGVDLPDAVYWVSSHPESEERAKAIVNYSKNKTVKAKAILDAALWKTVKEKVGSGL